MILCGGGDVVRALTRGLSVLPTRPLDPARRDATAEWTAQANPDLQSPKISGCYRSLIQTHLARTLPAGTAINSVTFTVNPGPSGEPPNLAGTGSGDINVTANGQAGDLVLDIAFITGHAVEALVTHPSRPRSATP